jgi:Hint module
VGDCRESIDKDGTYVTGTPVPASVFPFITSANPSSCFSGSDTVALESGGERALSEVRVGDRVLGADTAGRTSYSEVSGVVWCVVSQGRGGCRTVHSLRGEIEVSTKHGFLSCIASIYKCCI